MEKRRANGLSKRTIRTDKESENASLYTLSNENGMKVKITDYGANVVSIIVKDKAGTSGMWCLDMTMHPAMNRVMFFLEHVWEEMQTVWRGKIFTEGKIL